MLRLGHRKHLLLLPYFLLCNETPPSSGADPCVNLTPLPRYTSWSPHPDSLPVSLHHRVRSQYRNVHCSLRLYHADTPPLLSIHKPHHPSRCVRGMPPTSESSCLWFSLWHVVLVLLLSHQVMSDSLRAHGMQHTRPPGLSPPFRVCPSSCPLNRWCHPTISSSVTLFFFCLQSFPASGSLN